MKLLEPLHTIKVSSQILYYSDLTAPTTFNSTHHLLNPFQLRGFLNNEWNIGSLVSSDPELNMMLYLNEPTVSLQVINDKGNEIGTNAFLIPRWGGLVIRNLNYFLDSEQKSSNINSNLSDIFSIWRKQLRLLLGCTDRVAELALVPQMKKFRLHYTESRVGISLYELDALMRKKYVQALVASIDTLQSLGKLVDEMGNMIVEDKISRLVNEALAFIEKVR